MIVIGHRGAAAHKPENTLSSFRKAIEFGVDMIELDVQVCASGELVVIHDETVDRTTKGTGIVSQLTWTELQNLIIEDGQRIPSLEEVVELCQGRCKVNIELKGVSTGKPAAELVSNLLMEEGYAAENYLISSFDEQELLDFKSICPKVPLALLLRELNEERLSTAKRIGVGAINLRHEALSQEVVTEIHGHGLMLNAWTVNDQKAIERAVELGVDGIFSDFPDTVIKLLPVKIF